MKTRIKTMAILTALAAGTLVSTAQEQEAPARSERKSAEFKCPTCGSPCVSRAELMKAKRMRTRRAPPRAELMERFDLDGDGELSVEERAAAREQRPERKRRGRHQMQKRFDLDKDGVLSAEERAAAKQQHIQRFDTDSDGELSAEERAAAREQRLERVQRERQKLKEDFDLDGNGELSSAERAALKAYRIALRKERGRPQARRPAPVEE